MEGTRAVVECEISSLVFWRGQVRRDGFNARESSSEQWRKMAVIISNKVSAKDH